MALPLPVTQSGVMIAVDGTPFQADGAGTIYYLTPAQALEAIPALEAIHSYVDPRLVSFAHGTPQTKLTTDQQLQLFLLEHPDLTPDDLAHLGDPSVPYSYDPVKRLPYYVSYAGTRVYVNDGSIPKPADSFFYSYAWDDVNGGWKRSLDQGGIVGALEGAAAVAAPAIIGPVLTGTPTIFSAGAAASSATPVAASTTAAATANGVLPSTSLVSTAGMTAAAPSVASVAQSATLAGGVAPTVASLTSGVGTTTAKLLAPAVNAIGRTLAGGGAPPLVATDGGIVTSAGTIPWTWVGVAAIGLVAVVLQHHAKQ